MAIQRILHLIELAGITAKTLTQKAGLSQSAISEWKKGKAKPSADALVRIAEYFEVPIEYLLSMGVYLNWEDLWTDAGREAIIAAVYEDYPNEVLITGDSVIGEFRRAVLGTEIEMIRFFNWAVKSVKLEEVNEFSEYFHEWRDVTKAYIEYSDVFKMLTRESEPAMIHFTGKELADDFMARMKAGPYENLEEDEKELLYQYRGLTEIQKGEVFKVIKGFRYNRYKSFD
ncbi:MAG: helix-turn-helix transcriptional regulator [Lachnospiraceae bacterium]|nr:helix-turn-helix transcriptional regulator [Lachnospiraceae bacterium]